LKVTLKTVINRLLQPFEYIYLAAITLIDGMRTSGLLRSRRLPAPVVSIGNITVGGTGKTPSAIRFAEEAVARGFRPAILTRGYGGSAKGPVVVSAGKGPVIDATMAGDEAYLMAKKLPGIPVIKCPDRYKGGSLANDLFQPDLYILDDGFQHRALERDIDIVLVDGSRPFTNERLLPAGRLREPIKKALERADEVIITKAPSKKINKLKSDIAILTNSSQVSELRHKAVSIANTSGNTKPIASLSGRRVLAFSGIANPLHFKSMLVALGADVIKFISFSDHYRYGRLDMKKIRAEAESSSPDFIVTTEKDLVKLPLEDEFWALQIKVEFEAEMLKRVFSRISAIRKS